LGCDDEDEKNKGKHLISIVAVFDLKIRQVKLLFTGYPPIA
jgi:hypothetical protein